MANHRKIIHIDMDAFFASVEQRDNPALKGKPVIVGGDPTSRGVVATCSYEARAFGIRSAMSSANAYRLCPHAIFTPPRFEQYVAVSKQIRSIFREYTDLVEPLSLDEAFLDVTTNKLNIDFATRIAKEILIKIKEQTALTASAGVSINKFIAKIASDMNKPNGLTVILPEEAEQFAENLEIRKFFGVGKATEEKMRNLAIFTGADLKKMSLKELKRHFGKSAEYFYNISRGIDHRPVNPDRERKSLGTERTFQKDVYSFEEAVEILKKMTQKTADELQEKQFTGKTITLKVKYFDFTTSTRSITIESETNTYETIWQHVHKLIDKTEIGDIAVRLMGVTVSNLKSENDGESKDDVPH